MARQPSSASARSSKSSSKAPGKPRIRFEYLTLFPEIFEPVLSASLLGKAREKGLLTFSTTQIRDFSEDRHRTVDDTPYGGGDGMLLKADVLYRAWKSVVPRRSPSTRTLLLSPQGRLLTQERAKELSRYRRLVFVCGHYEGVDERFIEECVDEELSIGDYVLTGGELPALVATDVIARLVPGVVGKEGSVTGDSLEGGLLKYPQYTRPREFQGREVPQILLSGDHARIRAWRQEQMEKRTAAKRPDLWRAYLSRNS